MTRLEARRTRFEDATLQRPPTKARRAVFPPPVDMVVLEYILSIVVPAGIRRSESLRPSPPLGARLFRRPLLPPLLADAQLGEAAYHCGAIGPRRH